jgi:outer membrane protein TolC
VLSYSKGAGYAAGNVNFLRLIEAQRQLIALREQQVEMVSDFHRRLAELHRAAAVPVGDQ